MDLRRALGPAAGRLGSPTRDSLLLDVAEGEVDLIAFDRATAAGDDDALARAVALYRGPLLEGWGEEWVLPEREQRAETCLQALEGLAERALGRGECAGAEAYLRQAVTIDPLRDATQRRLMEALAARGDIPAAILIFREYRLRLHEELGRRAGIRRRRGSSGSSQRVRRTVLRRERPGAALSDGEPAPDEPLPAPSAGDLSLRDATPPPPSPAPPAPPELPECRRHGPKSRWRQSPEEPPRWRTFRAAPLPSSSPTSRGARASGSSTRTRCGSPRAPRLPAPRHHRDE